MTDSFAPPTEETLEALARAGALGWPQLTLAPEVFVAFLKARVEGLADAQVLRMPAADLFLVCACVHGDERAVAHLHDKYLSPIGQELQRMRIPQVVAEDVQSLLLEKLFAPQHGKSGAPIRLGEYSGTGELRSWLHIVAVREALAIMRQDRRRASLLENMDDLEMTVDDDPELAHLRSLYKAEFREAFVEALDVLHARERNLLRYRFTHGLSIDEVGEIYGVHRGTAARWIDAARVRLGGETQTRLMKRMQLGRAQVESILRLIRSQLDISVLRFLGGTEAEKETDVPPPDE